MSTGAAIAGTTQLLRMALQNFLPDLSGPLGGQPTVSALPPDRIITGNSEPVQLNLFLYRTELNQGWRNAMLPSRGSDGRRLTQPPLGLNLHYLVSAYAKEDLHADVLLGHAMEVLHGLSSLTPAMISQRFGGSAPPNVTSGLWQLLRASDLDRQADQLTVTLEPQTIDDISKLWSVLGEKYRPSVAYVVSVVLIEPKGPITTPLPVTERPVPEVAVRLRPALTALIPEALPHAAGASVTLHGSGLLSEHTTVLLGDVTAVPLAGGSSTRLEVALPNATPAGALPVRVRHSVTVGSRKEEFERSNALTLTVQPVPAAATVSSATASLPTRVSVTVTPAVRPDQDVRLLLNRTGSDQSSSLLPVRLTTDSATVEFPLPAHVPAGTYLYRLRVDGATSALRRAADGTFDGPVVVIP